MRCPFCQNPDTQVIDSRAPEEGYAIRRRRKCPACGKRFTTFERAHLPIPAVVKRNGQRRLQQGEASGLDDAGAAQASRDARAA